MTKTEKLLLLITAVFLAVAIPFLPRGSQTVRRTEAAFALPGPSPAQVSPEGTVYVTLTTRVDLNHATAEELTVLPGVGPVTAKAIVDYRDEHGLFSSVEDLLLVPGIGEATLDGILAAGGEDTP